jgi:hypothetical protein
MNHRLMSCLLGPWLYACGSPAPAELDAAATTDAPSGTADAPVDPPPPELPGLTLCRIPVPTDFSSAFVEHPGVPGAMTYTCAEPCADGIGCATDFLVAGQQVISGRGLPMEVIAFVVDDMAGHMIFTSDGDDTVVTHGGVGGTGGLHEFDLELQAHSTLKTVSLGWERGVGLFGGSGNGGAGWLTRKDATGTSIRALAARPAAAIRWVKDNLAPDHKLGTVGASFGTLATFGPHVWWGLDDILDYQMLIGGPPLWDVNIGCGRDHVAAGHCDLDVAPCAGNPDSSYGNDDPSCDTPTNQCRVPTIMAELGGGASEFNNAINYVGNTTACAPATTRDPALDASSLATTVTDWSFRGPIDFVTQEGAPQPPQSDQGMGEGHAMYAYLAVQSARRWIDHDGHHHGDAWQKDPALVAETATLVIAAMGH